MRCPSRMLGLSPGGSQVSAPELYQWTGVKSTVSNFSEYIWCPRCSTKHFVYIIWSASHSLRKWSGKKKIPQITESLKCLFFPEKIATIYQLSNWASLVAQLVKNPPAMWETWVRSLGWEDPLEKGTAAHSSILAWRIPWTGESMGSKRVRHDFHFQ